MAFTGTSIKLELMSCQLPPRFTVLKTCPLPNPETVRHARCGSEEATAMSVTQRFGNPEITGVHVAPPFVVTWTFPSLVPPQIVSGTEGAMSIPVTPVWELI